MTPPTESEVQPPRPRFELLVEGAPEAWVVRAIVVFRRLEPGEERAPGTAHVDQSPFIEAKVVDLAVPRELHAELVELAAERARVLCTEGFFRSYEPAGMVFSVGGAIALGSALDFMPASLIVPALVGMGLGGLIGIATRLARNAADAAAQEAWDAAPARPRYDELAGQLRDAMKALASRVRNETGYHTELRVAEGSSEPLRLASIDPGPYTATPPRFDPEDFLPSTGDAEVRYEEVHANGAVITRGLVGTRDHRDA